MQLLPPCSVSVHVAFWFVRGTRRMLLPPPRPRLRPRSAVSVSVVARRSVPAGAERHRLCARMISRPGLGVHLEQFFLLRKAFFIKRDTRDTYRDAAPRPRGNPNGDLARPRPPGAEVRLVSLYPPSGLRAGASRGNPRVVVGVAGPYRTTLSARSGMTASSWKHCCHPAPGFSSP